MKSIIKPVLLILIMFGSGGCATTQTIQDNEFVKKKPSMMDKIKKEPVKAIGFGLLGIAIWVAAGSAYSKAQQNEIKGQ